MGSAALAALFAHVTFWTLIVYGLAVSELSGRGAALFLCLWLAGWLGRPYVPLGAELFSPFVAILDIALVFAIAKGDVRLT